MPTSYLRPVFHWRDRQKTLKKLIKKIEKSNLSFDAIAFTGLSGVLIGPFLAEKLKKEIIICRKKGDSSHCDMRIERNEGEINKYIIVDDLIDVGDTVRRIVGEIKSDSEKSYDEKISCVGVFLYKDFRQSPIEVDGEEIPVFV